MLHAFELLPDAAGRAAVVSDWQALRDAGLPSQLDHRGPTNAPHVTLFAAEAIGPGLEQRAADLVGGLLPASVRSAGLVVMGGERVTVARVVDVDDALAAAVLSLRAASPGLRHRGWLPHLTLARRLPRADVQRAVDALGWADVELRLTELRRWDPEAREVRTLSLVT